MFAEVGPVVNSTELMVVRDALLHIHRVFYEKVKRGVGDAPSGVNATASGVSATHNVVNDVNGVNATHNGVNATASGVSATHNVVNGVNGVNGVNDVDATTNDGSDGSGTTDTPTEMTTSTAEVIREIRSRVLTGRVIYFDGMLQNQVRVQMWREA